MLLWVCSESVRALCCSNLADNARSSLLDQRDQIDYSGKIKLAYWEWFLVLFYSKNCVES